MVIFMLSDTVDVVVPCLDEESALPRVLASLPPGHHAIGDTSKRVREEAK